MKGNGRTHTFGLGSGRFNTTTNCNFPLVLPHSVSTDLTTTGAPESDIIPTLLHGSPTNTVLFFAFEQKKAVRCVNSKFIEKISPAEREHLKISGTVRGGRGAGDSCMHGHREPTHNNGKKCWKKKWNSQKLLKLGSYKLASSPHTKGAKFNEGGGAEYVQSRDAVEVSAHCFSIFVSIIWCGLPVVWIGLLGNLASIRQNQPANYSEEPHVLAGQRFLMLPPLWIICKLMSIAFVSLPPLLVSMSLLLFTGFPLRWVPSVGWVGTAFGGTSPWLINE